MDAIVAAALNEISARGAQGCLLQNLWSGLHSAIASAGLHFCDQVKQAIWQTLLKVPASALQLTNHQWTQLCGSRIISPSPREDLRLVKKYTTHMANFFFSHECKNLGDTFPRGLILTACGE